MNEYDKLKAHVQKRLSITEDELIEFCNAFKIVKVKKRQFIVQPEFVAKNRFYVVQGTFRAYVIGDEGQEHTIQFAISDWWISDYNSYIFQQPASMFIVALEDSVILQISHEAESALKQQRHVFETFFRILAEGTAAYMARRVITNLTKTAEQRYEIFLERYPDIVTKVPQYALASFLGMTTEYLSKLRNRRVSSKT
ncbi:cAMP-binding domain of CRP or a regulatory subunit of cAMP-dependent protein kinases [Pedobacter steynii]|uniref:cAMP-binding domain of CRP or a regulatory subunit of cAMP-dependent protein kinases n=1 Tax=Pedobacter steynii TaxID=430522 RepID=A0A1G9LEQ0_9SPHI|nr:Crp/Fnr family transcriptional regulator [Pedobacter steynii]NQX38822.1 Crp/Fnr family transcriptional regulator [Pedobacter steynii]SDL60253.1 cAMP-binding domain of CRP or a regulatory subunit of cAMP-dependent protein kinases [Pedobacter steynii]